MRARNARRENTYAKLVCSGPGGDSGGGSDPPLTEPSASGQGPVSDGGGGCGGGTFKGTIIGGNSGSDPPLTPSLAVTVFTLSPTFVSESSVLLEEDTDDWIDTGNVVGPNGFPAASPVNYEAAAPSSGADAGSASPALSPAESDGESDGESRAESNGKSGGESDCGGERRSGRRVSEQARTRTRALRKLA